MLPTSIGKVDVAFALCLGLTVALGAYGTSPRLPASVILESHRDVWFQAAAGSILSQAGDRHHSKHGRNNIHPFFSLAIHPTTQALSRGFGLDLWHALRLLTAGAAVVSIGSLFLVFRLMKCRRLDSVLLTLLVAVSATSVFFLGLPETFPFGAMSLVTALVVLAWSEHKRLSSWTYVGLNLLTVGFVTTNWMAGLLVTFATQRIRSAVRIVAIMLALAAILLMIEGFVYPASRFVLDIGDEMHFVNHPDAGGPWYVAASFFYHTMIMPAIHMVTNPNNVPGMPPTIMSVQLSPPGSAHVWGAVAVIAWTLLLIVGGWALWSLEPLRRLRVVVAFLLLGQLTLHLIYGEETFLYSLHFVVLLIMLPAFATLTRLRYVVVCLLILLIPTTAINNALQFQRAVAMFQQLESTPSTTHAQPVTQPTR